MLDRAVAYDHGDGLGLLSYSAVNGFDAKGISADNTYQVGNTEVEALVSAEGMGITVEMIQTGALDGATYTIFILDYENPTTGSAAILDAGDVGDVVIVAGMLWVPTLTSYSMRLSQPYGDVWQRPCRAVFGKPRDNPDGCGVDAEALWENGEVATVGAESDRTFTGDIAGYFPGRLEFLIGNNVGKLYAIESVSGNTITLADTTPFIIEAGDTFRHRPDCTKLKGGDFGCDYYDNYLNYNGENMTPVGDAASGTWPGAELATG